MQSVDPHAAALARRLEAERLQPIGYPSPFTRALEKENRELKARLAAFIAKEKGQTKVEGNRGKR